MGSHTILLKANILLLPIQDLRGKAATVAPVEHAVVMVLDQAGIFGQAFFEKGCAATVAPVDHADRVLEIRLSNPKVTPFSIKPFLKRFAVDHADRVLEIRLSNPKVTPFSIKPFLKRFAVDHAAARGFVIKFFARGLWMEFHSIINLVRLSYASEISFREREILKSFPFTSRKLPSTLPIII